MRDSDYRHDTANYAVRERLKSDELLSSQHRWNAGDLSVSGHTLFPIIGSQAPAQSVSPRARTASAFDPALAAPFRSMSALLTGVIPLEKRLAEDVALHGLFELGFGTSLREIEHDVEGVNLETVGMRS